MAGKTSKCVGYHCPVGFLGESPKLGRWAAQIGASAAVILLMLICPGPALPVEEVVPEIEYEYYDVTPEEGRSLYMSLFTATPIFHEGKNYAGLTKSYFSYRYQTLEPLADVCRVDNLEVKTRCVITLPRLTKGDPELNKAFDNYLNKLRGHELEHCRITTYHASQFKKYLAGIDDMKCQRLAKTVKTEYDRVNDDLNREQINYDKRTVHGKYEGADLNKHLSEMVNSKNGSQPKAHVSGGETSISSGGTKGSSGGLTNIQPDTGASGIYKDKNGVWRNY